MLYFSKTKLFTIYVIIFLLTISASTNLIKNEENFFLSKKINLGLDLQGGSYLLLEVDSEPIVNQKLQQKLIQLRQFLKKNKLRYKNLLLSNNIINFTIDNEDIEKFEQLILDKENPINFYYIKYKAHYND